MQKNFKNTPNMKTYQVKSCSFVFCEYFLWVFVCFPLRTCPFSRNTCFHLPFLLPSPARLFCIHRPDAATAWVKAPKTMLSAWTQVLTIQKGFLFLWAMPRQHTFRMTFWPCDQNLFFPSLFFSSFHHHQRSAKSESIVCPLFNFLWHKSL